MISETTVVILIGIRINQQRLIKCAYYSSTPGVRFILEFSRMSTVVND